MTVVGVVDDVSDVDLLQPPEPTVYAAWTQDVQRGVSDGPPIRANRSGRSGGAAVASGDREQWIRCSRSIASVVRPFSPRRSPPDFRTALNSPRPLLACCSRDWHRRVTARTIAERMPEFRVDRARLAGRPWRQVVIDQLQVVFAGAACGGRAGTIAAGCCIELPGDRALRAMVVGGPWRCSWSPATVAAAILRHGYCG